TVRKVARAAGARCLAGSPSIKQANIAGSANTAHAMYAVAHELRAATTSATAPAPADPIRQPYWYMPEPTPSCRGSSDSIRYASITTSYVAPANATKIAARAVAARRAEGSASARFTIETITGSRTPSSTQAQSHLRL